MGYGAALLQQHAQVEQEDFQKKAKKKSLWGSIGRTIGGLGVMALTGGAVNPLTLGLLTGGASFLGGAIGSKAAGGKLTGGRFFKSARESAQKELGAFGTQNLMSSLKSGITAGFGQAAKLQKAKLLGKPIAATPTASKGLLKSMDFEGSLVGKSLEKGRAARHASKIATADKLYGGDRTAAMKSFEFGEGDITAFDYDQRELGKARKTVTLGDAYDVDEEFGFDAWTAESSVDPGFSEVGKDWKTPWKGKGVSGSGIGETRMTVEDIGSAIPSNTTTPLEFSRPSDFTMPEKLAPTSKMKPQFNFKNLVSDYFAPQSMYESMDGEMVKHAPYRRGRNSLSTVIGGK